MKPEEHEHLNTSRQLGSAISANLKDVSATHPRTNAFGVPNSIVPIAIHTGPEDDKIEYKGDVQVLLYNDFRTEVAKRYPDLAAEYPGVQTASPTPAAPAPVPALAAKPGL